MAPGTLRELSVQERTPIRESKNSSQDVSSLCKTAKGGLQVHAGHLFYRNLGSYMSSRARSVE